MTNKEFVLELVRLIRPKYYNRITWILVSAGILLIAPPLTTVILHFFISSISKFNLIGEYDILWGFLLIILGLIFNILNQIINGSSSIRINFICNRGGSVTVNQNTIVVANDEKVQEIIKTLSKSNQNFSLNYSKTTFTSNFIELFKGFPWVKNISLEKIENDLEFFRIDYETSNSIAEHFFVNIYNTSEKELKLPSAPITELNSISNLAFVYWEKWGYWTLNTYQLFENLNLTFESAIKSDISNIIGDLTFIITNLKIKLTYDKDNIDSKAISHPDFGSLLKVELYNEDQYIDMDFLELGIIDSNIDMKVINTEQNGKTTIVTETVSYPHLFKLSNLMIRFLSKSGLSYEFKNTLLIRKSIIEFMKKIEAQKSYALPSSKAEQIDVLFKQAFGGTWVYKRYEKTK